MLLKVSRLIFASPPKEILFEIFDRFPEWEETMERLVQKDSALFKAAQIEYRYHYLDFPTLDQRPVREESFTEQLKRLVIYSQRLQKLMHRDFLSRKRTLSSSRSSFSAL